MLTLLLACSTANEPIAEVLTSVDSGVDAIEAADCRTSCSLGDATDEVHLTNEEVAFWMSEWNSEPIGVSTEALDTLLFYFPDTELALAQLEDIPLDVEHEAFLRTQLARDEVIVEMRLLDEEGEERGHMGPERIPLKTKQHLVFAGTGSLKHLETGGKVKRVGLGHLWSRW
jgi:hypothetical protein